MMKTKIKHLKQITGWLVLVITIGLFGYYWHTHPNFWTNIKNVDPSTIILLILLYSAVLLTNAAILLWSVRICDKTIERTESMLLNGYSTLVNFFGPLQSGPGFRAIYLKKKHEVSVKAYAVAVLIYYAAFGVFSLLMVSYGLSPLLAVNAFVVVLLMTVLGARYLNHRYPQFLKHPSEVIKVILFTAFQVILNVAIYFIELRTVNHGIHLRQAVIYTGAANLALFVSLTPGAIGFRETFLLFSKRLHHIDTHTVLAASVIDRAIYFIFLGLLFVATTGFHAKDKFKKSPQLVQ